MADVYTETSSTSYFGRIKNSIVGILFGLALVAGAFYLLFWNEGRAVRTEKGLKEGAAAVISVASDRVDPVNQGKLIHLTGPLHVSGTLKDENFGIEATGVLKLERVVEMYQWKESSSSETRKKLGGGEERVTTYSYEKSWNPSLISSEGFKQPANHLNPASMPFTAESMSAETVQLNAFRLSPGLLAQLTDAVDRPVTQADLEHLPDPIKAKVKLSDGKFYFGASPGNPQIGDTRVSFKIVQPSEVSVVAQQSADSFQPYITHQDTTIELIRRGQANAAEMFQAALSGNHMLTWLLRALGFFLMFLGWRLILGPLQVLADVVPFIGSLVGAGLSFISFLLALALSLGTIAIAWIYYRPWLGIGLLAVVLGVLVLLISTLRKNRPPVGGPVTTH